MPHPANPYTRTRRACDSRPDRGRGRAGPGTTDHGPIPVHEEQPSESLHALGDWTVFGVPCLVDAARASGPRAGATST